MPIETAAHAGMRFRRLADRQERGLCCMKGRLLGPANGAPDETTAERMPSTGEIFPREREQGGGLGHHKTSPSAPTFIISG